MLCLDIPLNLKCLIDKKEYFFLLLEHHDTPRKMLSIRGYYVKLSFTYNDRDIFQTPCVSNNLRYLCNALWFSELLIVDVILCISAHSCVCPVPDLQLFLRRGPCCTGQERGGGLPAPKKCYNGCLLMWCNSNFESVLFRSDSRHNDRVDSL